MVQTTFVTTVVTGTCSETDAERLRGVWWCSVNAHHSEDKCGCTDQGQTVCSRHRVHVHTTGHWLICDVDTATVGVHNDSTACAVECVGDGASNAWIGISSTDHTNECPRSSTVRNAEIVNGLVELRCKQIVTYHANNDQAAVVERWRSHILACHCQYVRGVGLRAGKVLLN